MKNPILQITHQGKTTQISLSSTHPHTLNLPKDATYQVLDKTGKPVKTVLKKQAGKAKLYVDGDDAYSLIIDESLNPQSYLQYADSGLTGINEFGLADNGLVELPAQATTPPPLTSSSVISTSGAITKAGSSVLPWLGAGAAAVGVGAVALRKTNNSSDNKQQQNQSNPSATNTQTAKEQKGESTANDNKPTITLSPITGDNIISLDERQAVITLTGKIDNATTDTSLDIIIGQATYHATIKDNTFSVAVDGKTLANHTQISLNLIQNGQLLGSQNHDYEVKAEPVAPVVKPTLSLDNITDDNIINLQESQNTVKVSGTADNAQDGDTVIVSCGCPSCTGVQWVDIPTQIKDGKFSVEFAGQDLISRNLIKAKLGETTTQKDYQVDIEPPSFVYHVDNAKLVINQQSPENITLKGKVINLPQDSQISEVVLQVGTKSFKPTLQGDYYTIDIPKADFANANALTWTLTAKDNAGNQTTQAQTQNYVYDVDIKTPNISIEPINTVNADSTQISLNGQFDLDNDIDPKSVKVQVQYQNQVFDAKVNLVQKSWSLVLPTDKLADQQGEHNLNVIINAKDRAGNETTGTQTTSFVVDTVAPKVGIELNTLNDIAHDGNGQSTLTGKLTGEFNTTDKVQINVNNQTLNANVNKQGEFSLAIDNALLKKDSDHRLTAKVITTDSAGNVAEVSKELGYQVQSEPVVVQPPAPPVVPPTPPSEPNKTEPPKKDSEPTPPKTDIPTDAVLSVQNGEQIRYFSDFETALGQVGAGDKMTLLKDIAVLRNYTLNAQGKINPLSLPALDIDGDGHTLKIGERPLSLDGDVSFKNLTLALQPAVSLNTAFTSLGKGGVQAAEQYIYLNGHHLSLDKVATNIDGQHTDTRPVVVMGSGFGKDDAGRATLTVKNADQTKSQTIFKAIIAGSTDSDKSTPSVIDLGSGTKVLDSVNLGGKDHTMTGKVTLTNASNQVKTIVGTGTDNVVTLHNVNYLTNPTLTGIKELHLTGNSQMNSQNLVVDNLHLASTSRLSIAPAPFSDDEATLTVKHINADNATLSVADTTKLDIDTLQGTLTVSPTLTESLPSQDNLKLGTHIKADKGDDSYTLTYSDSIQTTPTAPTPTEPTADPNTGKQENDKQGNDNKGDSDPVKTDTATSPVATSPVATPPVPKNLAQNTHAHISIREIGETGSVMPTKPTATITGKVDLNHGIFAKYHNADLINGVQATVNGKTYITALTKERTFAFDIPIDELKAAGGQKIEFNLPKDKIDIYDLKWGQYSSSPKIVLPQKAKIDDQSKFILDNTDFVDNTTKTVKAITADETVITGSVAGDAKVGDMVTVKVGDKSFDSKVEQLDFGLGFVALAPTDIMQSAIHKTVIASVKTDTGTASTYQHYHTGLATGEKKINTDHSHLTENDLPYFINLVRFRGGGGFLRKAPEGSHIDLTYTFRKAVGNYQSYNEANREATRKILDRLEDFINVDFTEVDETKYSYHLNYSFIKMNSKGFGGTVNGLADYGGPEVLLNVDQYQPLDTSKGIEWRQGEQTTVHETLHTLGAKHPFQGQFQFSDPYGKNWDNTTETSSVATDNKEQENDKSISVMGYKKTHHDTGTLLGVFDLAYLHYRYGVRETHRAGDDTYGFKAYNPYREDGDIYIWDGAGLDTFDASDQTQAVMVDLTPGSWIYSGKKSDNFIVESSHNWDKDAFFKNYGYNIEDVRITPNVTYTKGQAFIGYGTQIERLIGSKFDDTLKGNVADNDIFGGAGDDKIWGDDGNDYLDGGAGIDEMTGGKGNDIFVVDNKDDKIIEESGEGVDTVYAHINYTLPDHVENINLFGLAQNATGNTGDNRITGNDLSNTLTGNGGDDVFVFNSVLNGQIDHITDFNQGDKLELAKTVFKGLTDETSLDKYLSYDKATGQLSYDADGKDTGAEAVVFAVLDNRYNLILDTSAIVIV